MTAMESNVNHEEFLLTLNVTSMASVGFKSKVHTCISVVSVECNFLSWAAMDSFVFVL